MSNIKLKDILKNKEVGDEWFTLMAPEHLHQWNHKKPWPAGSFTKKGVHLLGARVSASKSLENVLNRDDKFSNKAPLHLKNGLKITDGYWKTSTSQKAGMKIRADGSIEFNEILEDLMRQTGIKIWDVKNLEVSNDKMGIVLEYKHFNPDANASRLYLYRSIQGGNEKLFPDILLSTQKEMACRFFDMFAHCSCAEEDEKPKYHACATEVAIKSKNRQSILRKNKKKYGVKRPV